MKWRSTAIYLLVLLLLGGIYLVIDAKKKEADRKEKESRRIFTFDPAAVKGIEIESGGKKIRLEKGDNWKITDPISADADKVVFADFFSSLQNLEQERKIGEQAGNADAFGLDKPSLVIRLQTGADWLSFQAGGLNPAETARYARAGQGGDIFMISIAAFSALNKNLKDLRRKELFSWQTDQVSEVDVKWQGGEEFSLERQGGAKRWKSASMPALAVKARKVENLLDDLHWLRAVDFVEKDLVPPQPQLEVTLKLKDGKTSSLRVADPGEAKKQVVVESSEIQGPVLVASNIFASFPRSAVSLADRSLISDDASEIRRITWQYGNGSGDLVWMDGNNWGAKDGENAPKVVENSGQVRGFLAFMENAEYYVDAAEPASPGADPSRGATDSVRFEDVFGKKSSLAWDKLPAENSSLVTVWMEREGAPHEVMVKYDTMKRLNELLALMSQKR